jgi:hypothetical protein
VFEAVKARVTKAKFRRIEVTVVLMYLQDAGRDPLFKVGRETVTAIAKNIASYADLDPPAGKGTSPSFLKKYYEWWLENVARGAGIRLDPKRLFDDADRKFIRKREQGLCAICDGAVESEDEEFDHFPVPHHAGGRTARDNGRLVHQGCHPRGRPVDGG